MPSEPIVLLDVPKQNEPLQEDLRRAFERVLESGQFIMGPEVAAFEKECASFIGVDHAISVSSGTDALLVSLMALGVGPGDEVITTPFTFFATGGCIARTGARPVFVDIESSTFNIDPSAVKAAIGPATKAVIPVHLFGQACDMNALREVCGEIPIIEDAAQALGSSSRGARVGSIGKLGCFSFFPSKKSRRFRGRRLGVDIG